MKVEQFTDVFSLRDEIGEMEKSKLIPSLQQLLHT